MIPPDPWFGSLDLAAYVVLCGLALAGLGAWGMLWRLFDAYRREEGEERRRAAALREQVGLARSAPPPSSTREVGH